jgi:dTMP kinase
MIKGDKMFITFEGIDFCGKSTQVELLRKYLIDNNKHVELVREPGGTKISEQIRSVLLDKVHTGMCSETELFLFSAARAQLVREKIRPYLQKGYYVISDRLHDSSTAYQGFGRGLSIDAILSIHNLALGDTIPDITFLMDIPIEEMNIRKSQKLHRELDRIESSGIEFYNKIRNGYNWILEKEPKRFKRIDGTQSIQQVHEQIIKIIKEYKPNDF